MKRLSVVLIVLLTSCFGGDDYTPKPKGYFRIEVPQKVYKDYNQGDCPFTFEINQVTKVIPKKNCWSDIVYPKLRATIQMTYKPVLGQNLNTLLREGQELAYKHIVKADGIQEKLFVDAEKRVYGQYYSIAGDAASSTQFYVTDSANHYLRGVLYFYATPNADSLKPVTEFMQGEIIHMIESLEWKE